MNVENEKKNLSYLQELLDIFTTALLWREFRLGQSTYLDLLLSLLLLFLLLEGYVQILQPQGTRCVPGFNSRF